MRKTGVVVCLVLLASFALFALAGCTAKVTGNLRVDGTPFAVGQCRSGQAFGFSGIELTDANGRRLRLLANPDGTCDAAFFSGSGPTGDRLGQCGELEMTAQPSRINSITNLMGAAKLTCDEGGHSVTGSVEFKNCH